MKQNDGGERVLGNVGGGHCHRKHWEKVSDLSGCEFQGAPFGLSCFLGRRYIGPLDVKMQVFVVWSPKD